MGNFITNMNAAQKDKLRPRSVDFDSDVKRQYNSEGLHSYKNTPINIIDVGTRTPQRA
jgi:hypothetical protein